MEMECRKICPNLIGFTPPAFIPIAHYYQGEQMKEVKCVAHFNQKTRGNIKRDFKEIQYGGVHRHLVHCGHLATS
jgi:hypothetical protein